MARERASDGKRAAQESRAGFRPRLILFTCGKRALVLCCLLPTACCLLLPVGSARVEGTLEQQRERIEGMTTEQKAELALAEAHFRGLEPAQQERLRELERQIQSDTDREELCRVMARYYAWVKELPAYRRADLLEGSPEERMEKIKQILAEQARGRARYLSPGDAEALRRWADAYIKRFLASLPESTRDHLKGLKAEQRRREVLAMVIPRWIAAAGGKEAPITEEELADLKSKLSPQARKFLESRPPERQWRIVAFWLRQAWFHQGGMPPPFRSRQPVDAKKLTEFFEQLNPEQQEYLLDLPGEEMKAMLERMYGAHELPGRPDFPPFGPHGPMPPDMPGPGRGPGPPPHGRPFPGPPEPEEPPPRETI